MATENSKCTQRKVSCAWVVIIKGVTTGMILDDSVIVCIVIIPNANAISL